MSRLSSGIILGFILFAGSFELRGQSVRNAAHFELGGSAIVPSINYERRFNDRWWGRAGFSLIAGESSGGTNTTFIFPLTVSSVSHPLSRHHLELGGGVTLITGDRQDLFLGNDDEGSFSSALATGIAGYRYQKPDGGFQLRGVVTPVAGAGIFEFWLGVSLGYAW